MAKAPLHRHRLRLGESVRIIAFAVLAPLPAMAALAVVDAAAGGWTASLAFAALYPALGLVAAWGAARRSRRRRALDELAEAAWKLSATRALPATPLAESSPDTARLAGILRRRSEKTLRQAKRVTRRSSQHRQLLDLLEEGVMLLGPDNDILLSNAALDRMARFDQAEARPQTVEEVLREGVFLRQLAKARESGQERRLTLSRVEPSQTLEIHIKPLARESAGEEAEAKGQLVGVVIRDITRQTRLENARREFVGNVGHELRTPLAAIRGYVDTLREGAAEDPALAGRFLDVISRHATRLQSLIDDLLELARLDDPAQGRGSMESVDLRDTLDGAIEATRHRFEAKRIRLDDQVPRSLPAISGLRGPLERVFINLLDNATNYSEPETTVTLFARVDGGSVEVGVRDQGIGIPAEHLGRIFERFYRVDKDRSRGAGGTGLGLSIVKNTVKRCRGETRVESEVGKGSTFYVQLARAEPDA